MHYKHLSLALLMVASAFAHQVPRRTQLPPLSGDALSLPSSRSTQGSSPASTNGWDYVPNDNEIKRICTGPKRNQNQALCNKLEQFHQAMRQAGAKAKSELRAAEQMSTQGTLSREDMENTLMLLGKHYAITPDLELIKALENMVNNKQITEENLAEVIQLAPSLIFAHNAGSTRTEQIMIANALVMSSILGILMAQLQPAPANFPLD